MSYDSNGNYVDDSSSGSGDVANTADTITAAAQLAKVIATSVSALNAQKKQDDYLKSLASMDAKNRNIAVTNQQSEDSLNKAKTLARALSKPKFNPAPSNQSFDFQRPQAPGQDYTGNIVPGLLDAFSRSGAPKAIASAISGVGNYWNKLTTPAWNQQNGVDDTTTSDGSLYS